MKWFFQTVHHELVDYNLPLLRGCRYLKDGKDPGVAQSAKIG